MTDETPTTVIFRELSGETIAFFPEMPGSSDRYTCGSYVHVGQHGVASHAFYAQTRPAADYDDLLDELESIGYVLRVRRRWTQAMDRARYAEWDRINAALILPAGTPTYIRADIERYGHVAACRSREDREKYAHLNVDLVDADIAHSPDDRRSV